MFLEGFGALNEGAVNLETGRKCWRYWNIRDTALEAGFTTNRRISLESHLTFGECCASQGHPRMMSTVVPPVPERRWFHGGSSQPAVTGGDQYLIRPSGFLSCLR